MGCFGKSLAGAGYVVLNIIRVLNIIALLAVIAASSVMLVKTFIVSKFFFFDACEHVVRIIISGECNSVNPSQTNLISLRLPDSHRAPPLQDLHLSPLASVQSSLWLCHAWLRHGLPRQQRLGQYEQRSNKSRKSRTSLLANCDCCWYCHSCHGSHQYPSCKSTVLLLILQTMLTLSRALFSAIPVPISQLVKCVPMVLWPVTKPMLKPQQPPTQIDALDTDPSSSARNATLYLHITRMLDREHRRTCHNPHPKSSTSQVRSIPTILKAQVVAANTVKQAQDKIDMLGSGVQN